MSPTRNPLVAFTLIEISIAVGIFAVTIVAILALFPVALRSAEQSRTESIVTQIARTVLTDLRSGAFEKARIATSAVPDFLEYNLAQAASTPVYLGYDEGGKVIGELAAASYAEPNPAVVYVVKLESELVTTTVPLLSRVTVTVESPGAAPATARRKYPLTTLMGDTR
ncbi:MAG TPA: hypothetical protein VIT91_17930 [Chthoniobacterales bacterium]